MTKQQMQWVAAVVLVAVAGWRIWVAFQQEPAISEKAWYYDLSRKELFVADRGAIAPIRGTDGPVEDGVRAVVVSPPGKCDDPQARRIAYLETHAPELKAALEAAKARGAAPTVSRAEAQTLRWVKRVGDAEWVPLGSPEGERVVSEWAVPGPDGVTPAVCAP